MSARYNKIYTPNKLRRVKVNVSVKPKYACRPDNPRGVRVRGKEHRVSTREGAIRLITEGATRKKPMEGDSINVVEELARSQ